MTGLPICFPCPGRCPGTTWTIGSGQWRSYRWLGPLPNCLLFLTKRTPSTDSAEMSIDESQGQDAKEALSGIKRSTNLLTSGLGGEGTWRAVSLFHSKGYHKLGSVGLDSGKPNFLMKPHLSVVLERTHQWGNDGWFGVRKNGNQCKPTESNRAIMSQSKEEEESRWATSESFVGIVRSWTTCSTTFWQMRWRRRRIQHKTTQA